MLRFTLHRPSRNSAVCTCCHAMVCRVFLAAFGKSQATFVCVACGHRANADVPTLRCTLRCDVFAVVTGLGRLRSFHFFDVDGSPRGAGHGFDVEVSTRITSNLAGRSVLVLSTQSLRRSPSLAFSPSISAFTLWRRLDPRATRVAWRRSTNDAVDTFNPEDKVSLRSRCSGPHRVKTGGRRC